MAAYCFVLLSQLFNTHFVSRAEPAIPREVLRKTAQVAQFRFIAASRTALFNTANATLIHPKRRISLGGVNLTYNNREETGLDVTC